MDENENTNVTVEETETTYYDDCRPTFGQKIVKTGITIAVWEGVKFAGSKLLHKLGWARKDKKDGKVVKVEKTKTETTESKNSEED